MFIVAGGPLALLELITDDERGSPYCGCAGDVFTDEVSGQKQRHGLALGSMCAGGLVVGSREAYWNAKALRPVVLVIPTVKLLLLLPQPGRLAGAAPTKKPASHP